MAAKLPIIGSVALIAVGSVVYAASRVNGPGWYDPLPLSVSLRPEARSGLQAALGLARPSDLTLYDLTLAYDPAQAAFNLGEDVWFTNTTGAPLSDVVLRIYANAMAPPSGPEVRFLSGTCETDKGCGFTLLTDSAIRVAPSAPLPQGGRLHFSLSLSGTLTHIDASRTSVMAQGLEGMMSMLGGGAGGGDYGILAVGDGIVSMGNFYAVIAARSDRGWETHDASKLGDFGSDDIASFKASVDLPVHAKVAVTGVVTSVEPILGKPELHRVNITAGAIRDFALLFGDDLEVSEERTHGVRVRSFALAADRAAGRKVLEYAEKALEVYEARFGQYPYTDLTVSEEAIVGGAGGVEFSGLVTAASMFYRPTGLGSMTDGMLEFIVAHEVAHQYWHGLVGSDSREHPYVDEALAQYSAMVYLEDRYGAARAEKDGNANAKMNYQAMRMLGGVDAPVDRAVASFASMTQYGGVIYGKAPYYYKAVRQALGDAAFFGALRTYVTQFRWKRAGARSLPDLFAQAGGEARMRPLERHWLDEMHGDEDLGSLDLGSLLGGMAGAGALGGLGAGTNPDDLMKLVQQLGGMMGAPPGAGGVPAKPTGDVDVDAILKAFGGGE